MDQVEEVKNKVDIVEIVSEHVMLKKAGRNYKGLCPFHGEKTPSFMVNPELQIYKCFGCGEGGDVYSFLQKIEGMEFGEALLTLAGRAGVTLTSYRPSQGEEIRNKLIEINTLAAEAYHYLLMKHKAGRKALEYLRGRGINKDSLETFRLGYAPEEWEFLVKYLTKKKDFKMDDLRRAGLVVEGRNYDRFRNRIMFPLADGRGRIFGFAGRQMPGADEKAGGKYVNTPETEIYRKSELLYGLDSARSEIKKEGWAGAVEGQMDLIPSWQAGVRNVVGIGGTALTERQVEVLRRLTDTLVLALDTDFAGDAAARRGIEVADKAGFIIKMVKLRGVKDPGEMATANPEEWKKAVGEAIPVYDFYIESAVERFGLRVEGKKKIGQELLPIWVKISDEIVKAHYIKKLAEVLGVGEEDVRKQMEKTSNSKFPDSNQLPIEQAKKTRREVVEEYLVGLAVNAKAFDKLREAAKWFKTEFWKRVAAELEEKKDVRKLPAELRSRIEGLVFLEDEWSEKEWMRAMDELEEVAIREQIGAEEGDVMVLTKRLAELTKDK